MVKPVQYGRVQRMSYSKIDEILDIPDLLEIQKSSYQWFLDEGLMEVLNEVSPISDFSGDIELSFIGFDFDIENPTYSIEECKERDANYAAKMNMKVRLHDRKMDVMKEEDVYVGEFPIMTDTGSFIINGAERVIISQLVRSPGTYFDVMLDKNDIELYTAQVIPNRGAWIEFESDAKRLLWVRVDRQRKFHLTILLRALGIGTDEEKYPFRGENILDLYNELATVTLFRALGKTRDEIADALSDIVIGRSRKEVLEAGEKRIYRMLAKGKNPIAVSRVLDAVHSIPGKKQFILLIDTSTDTITLDDNAAWIFDADLALLNDSDISRVVIAGGRCEDFRLALLFAGVDERKIVTRQDRRDAADARLLEEGPEPIAILYSLYSEPISRTVTKRLYERLAKEAP
jgi:DNA-directed RNA polymerase beta subunit